MLDQTVIGACSKCGFSIAACICENKGSPKLSVTKKFKFDAAHKLPNYKGKCKNLHGHGFYGEVEFFGPVNEKTGMVIDFSEIKSHIAYYIIQYLDHSYLNDILENPTAENLVLWIVLKLRGINWGKNVELTRIRLYETEDSYAEWRKN